MGNALTDENGEASRLYGVLKLLYLLCFVEAVALWFVGITIPGIELFDTIGSILITVFVTSVSVGVPVLGFVLWALDQFNSS